MGNFNFLIKKYVDETLLLMNAPIFDYYIVLTIELFVFYDLVGRHETRHSYLEHMQCAWADKE